MVHSSSLVMEGCLGYGLFSLPFIYVSLSISPSPLPLLFLVLCYFVYMLFVCLVVRNSSDHLLSVVCQQVGQSLVPPCLGRCSGTVVPAELLVSWFEDTLVVLFTMNC